jgi:multicomponent Na+:H+ antiporter subunit C
MSEPTVNLTLVLGSAGLIGCGVYLLLERSLSRALVGLVMIGNGVALGFMVASGPAGKAPIMVDGVEQSDISDPLPQAMVLTAIVITLATTAFVMAMAYRSWQLNGHDDVQDDPEDALIRRLADHDVTSEAYSAESASTDVEADHDDSDFAVDELEAFDPEDVVPLLSEHPDPRNAGTDVGREEER